jgi:hypothetical protein
MSGYSVWAQVTLVETPLVIVMPFCEHMYAFALVVDHVNVVAPTIANAKHKIITASLSMFAGWFVCLLLKGAKETTKTEK